MSQNPTTEAPVDGGVAVLGMHRSGTSAIGRLLSAIGGYAGEAADLMAAKPDNPHGFFERLDLYRLHEDLLAEADLQWDSLGEFPIERLDSVAREKALVRLAPILDLLTSGAGFPFVKDPRLAFFMGLWAPIWRPRAILVMVRHPLSVASSLRTRNEMNWSHALALWESHTIQALVCCPGVPRLVVSFEALCADPEAEAERIAVFLRRHEIEVMLTGAAHTVDPQIVHHRSDDWQGSTGWPWIDGLWAEAQEASRSGQWNGESRRLSATSRELLELVRQVSVRRDVAHAQELQLRSLLDRERARYEELSARRESELSTLHERIAALETEKVRQAEDLRKTENQHLEQMTAHRHRYSSQIATLLRQTEELEVRRAAARRESAEREVALRAARRDSQRAQADVQHLRVLVAERDARLATSAARLRSECRLSAASSAELQTTTKALARERAEREVAERTLGRRMARVEEVEAVLKAYEASRPVRWGRILNRLIGRS